MKRPTSDALPARADRSHSAQSAARRLHAQGIKNIEFVLSPDDVPLLGLYVYAVQILLLRSLTRNPRYRTVKPHLLGTPALLSKHPGLSQIELAALLGNERATAGLQVAQCIAQGLVRRVSSKTDKRRYELYITTKGLRMLEAVRSVVPSHEQEFAAVLTMKERRQLRELLTKLIAGA